MSRSDTVSFYLRYYLAPLLYNEKYNPSIIIQMLRTSDKQQYTRWYKKMCKYEGVKMTVPERDNAFDYGAITGAEFFIKFMQIFRGKAGSDRIEELVNKIVCDVSSSNIKLKVAKVLEEHPRLEEFIYSNRTAICMLHRGVKNKRIAIKNEEVKSVRPPKVTATPRRLFPPRRQRSCSEMAAAVQQNQGDTRSFPTLATVLV